MLLNGVAALLLLGSAVASQETPLRVWPLPQTINTGNSTICLSPKFYILYDDSFGASLIPKDLLVAVRRTEDRLWTDKNVYLSPTRGLEFFETASGGRQCAGYLNDLLIGLDYPYRPKTIPDIKECSTAPVEARIEMEEYSLEIPVGGRAILKSKTSLGLLRGLTTFEQLFYTLDDVKNPAQTKNRLELLPESVIGSEYDDVRQIPLGTGGVAQNAKQMRMNQSGLDKSGTVFAPFGPYYIEDKPAFGWRGVLLDTSRNYFSVPTILKMLDTMAMVKLNVFHWHITDSNSWPLELSVFPELSAKGAYSSFQKYSESDVQLIVNYAGERGIDVVMEIDTPGHTAIIAESHPEHIACYEKPFSTYALQPPAGQLRFANQETIDFTKQLLGAASGLVHSRYFGTGGDELNMKCMEDDEETTKALIANNWTLNDALNNCVSQTHRHLRSGGKTPVVWQEMVLDHGSMPGVSKDTIIDIWKSSKHAREVLDKGFRVVLAPADYFYLDCGQGGWITVEGGSNSWCDPFKPWTRMYAFDPYDNVDDTQRDQILGGQACLWAEQTDETNIEQVMWPRAAVVGEIFWSGTKDKQTAKQALPRMHDIRYRMVRRGVNAVPLQPHWCALRPDKCVQGM